MPKKVLSFLFVVSFCLISSFSLAQDCEKEEDNCYVENVTVEYNTGSEKTTESKKIPDSYGLKTLLVFIVLMFIIAKLAKPPPPPRDPFLKNLEDWIKSYDDKRIKDHVELHIEEKFPDFKAWKKNQNKK